MLETERGAVIEVVDTQRGTVLLRITDLELGMSVELAPVEAMALARRLTGMALKWTGMDDLHAADSLMTGALNLNLSRETIRPLIQNEIQKWAAENGFEEYPHHDGLLVSGKGNGGCG